MDRKFLFLTQSQWKRLLVALAISSLALWLRINMAIYGPIEADEPAYVDAAVRYSNDIHTGNWGDIVTSDVNFEHPPFFKLVYGLIMPMPKAGNGIPMAYDTQITTSNNFIRLLSLRLISVFLGTLAVFMLALLNPWAGLLLAMHTFAVKYTGVVYLESLPLTLSALSVIASGKWLNWVASRKKMSPIGLSWFLISAFAMGFAVASKYMYAVAGMAIVIFGLYLAVRKSANLLKYILAWCLIVPLVFFLGDPVLWINPVGNFIRSTGYWGNYSLNHVVYPFWQPFVWLSLPIPQQPSIHVFQRPGNFLILLDSLYLPLALIGGWRLSRDHPLYALWLLVGLVALLLWPTKWPQYVLIILFPYCLSAALGLDLLRVKMVAFLQEFWEKESLANGSSRPARPPQDGFRLNETTPKVIKTSVWPAGPR